jgi:hypothetical protein
VAIMTNSLPKPTVILRPGKTAGMVCISDLGGVGPSKKARF